MTSLARIFQAIKRGRLSYVNISNMRLDGILLMLGIASKKLGLVTMSLL